MDFNITIDQARALVANGEKMTPSQRAKAAEERLRALVLYAKKRSPYFQHAYRSIERDFVLSDLPATSKAELMRNYENWVTDSEITLSALREYLSDIGSVSDEFLGRYTAITTSGTTGEPMPMVRDKYHNMIHGCLMEQRLLKSVDLNLLNPARTRIASVIASGGFVSSYSSAMRVKKAAGEFSKNMEVYSILTPPNQLVKQLNEFEPEFLTGYPSALLLLAKEKNAGRLNITPKAIASSAELLTIEAFENLKQTFGCPVLNNYCSTEGGEIAMSCSKGHLHLNDDWIILEPVDNQLRPTQPGEWSDGVLITDLSNYVQPIIRYHVNDSVRIGAANSECDSSLPIIEISGRSGDPLCFSGVTVPFLVLYVIMIREKTLLGWQLIQTGSNELEVRYIAEDTCDRSAVGKRISEELRQSLKEYGCGNVDVFISDKEFMRSPRGDKVPYTVCRAK